MARTKILSIGGGSVFASGGVTNNVIPKSNGAGALADSSITDNGTNVTSTEAFLAPVGSATLPGYAFSGGANNAASGMYFTTASTSILNTNGVVGWLSVGVGATGMQIRSDAPYGWNSSTAVNGGSMDAGFRRRGAANIFLGIAADVNGVPVAQTLGVQNAITGSNLAAANWTLAAGLGTGTGAVGQFIVTGADSSVATGTTAQTGVIRCVLNATKALTTGAATTLVSIPLATLQMAGGYISVYMEATDGTNQATRSEEIYYAGENSAGVFVVSQGVVGTGVTACTAAKTLTATYALTGANPALLQVTPTLTGITATRFTCIYEVHHMGNTQPTV